MYDFEKLTTLQTYVDYYQTPIGTAQAVMTVVLLAVGLVWGGKKLTAMFTRIR